MTLILASTLPRWMSELFGDLSPLDWVLLAIALWSVVQGLRRGLIRELFSLLAVAGALLVASWNYAALATLLSRWVPSPPAAAVAGFLLLLAATLLLLLLVGRLTRSAAHMVGLGPLDRLAGALFSLARTAVVLAAVLAAVSAYLPPVAAVRSSRLVPPLLQVARAGSALVPADLRVRMLAGLGRIVQTHRTGQR